MITVLIIGKKEYIKNGIFKIVFVNFKKEYNLIYKIQFLRESNILYDFELCDYLIRLNIMFIQKLTGELIRTAIF